MMQTPLCQVFRCRVLIPRLIKEPTSDSHVSEEFVSTGLKVCIGTGTASDSPPSMTPAANDHEDRKPGEYTMHVAFTPSNNMSM
jgi:hypothetical protein